MFLLTTVLLLALASDGCPKKQAGELSVKFAGDGTFDCETAKTPEFRQAMMDFIGMGADEAPKGADGENLYIRECGTLEEINADGAFLDDGGFGRNGDKSLFQMWDTLNDAGSISPIEYEEPLGIEPPKDEDGIYVNFGIHFGTSKDDLEAYNNWGEHVADTETFKEGLETALNDALGLSAEEDPPTALNVIAYFAAQRTDENCGAPECTPQANGDIENDCSHCAPETVASCVGKLPVCEPKGEDCKDDDDLSTCEEFDCDHCADPVKAACEASATKCEQKKIAALKAVAEVEEQYKDDPDKMQEEIDKIAVIDCDESGHYPTSWCGPAADYLAKSAGVPTSDPGSSPTEALKHGCACVDPDTGDLVLDSYKPDGQEPDCDGSKPFPTWAMILLAILAALCLAFCLYVLCKQCCCKDDGQVQPIQPVQPVNPVKPVGPGGYLPRPLQPKPLPPCGSGNVAYSPLTSPQVNHYDPQPLQQNVVPLNVQGYSPVVQMGQMPGALPPGGQDCQNCGLLNVEDPQGNIVGQI